MSTGNVVLGTLAGLAIGAVTGILYAPQKGSTTRKQIMDKSDDYADELKSKVDEFSDSLADKVESIKKDAENLAEKGKAKYDEAKKDVRNASTNFNHATS
ncbi:MAG: YtxH domain-containing protein [Bacteroidales bacterium]|nr:YtxH domain-containing protein [Bacteroidales bacterium]